MTDSEKKNERRGKSYVEAPPRILHPIRGIRTEGFPQRLEFFSKSDSSRFQIRKLTFAPSLKSSTNTTTFFGKRFRDFEQLQNYYIICQSMVLRERFLLRPCAHSSVISLAMYHFKVKHAQPKCGLQLSWFYFVVRERESF